MLKSGFTAECQTKATEHMHFSRHAVCYSICTQHNQCYIVKVQINWTGAWTTTVHLIFLDIKRERMTTWSTITSHYATEGWNKRRTEGDIWRRAGTDCRGESSRHRRRVLKCPACSRWCTSATTEHAISSKPSNTCNLTHTHRHERVRTHRGQAAFHCGLRPKTLYTSARF